MNRTPGLPQPEITAVIERVVLPDVYPDVVELEITTDDIARGQSGRPSGCPVALAARRRWDGADFITVSPVGVTIFDGNPFHIHAYRGGPRLWNFVTAFDRGPHRTIREFLLRRPGRPAVAPTTITLRRIR